MGFHGCSLFIVVHFLVSSLAIISLGKKESWLLYLNCLLMPFDSLCSLSLPQDSMDWSTVCECGVS